MSFNKDNSKGGYNRISVSLASPEALHIQSLYHVLVVRTYIGVVNKTASWLKLFLSLQNTCRTSCTDIFCCILFLHFYIFSFVQLHVSLA